MPAGERALVDRLRGALCAGLFAVVLLSPLPFGSVGDRAVLGLELFAFLLGLGTLWVIALDPGALTGRARSSLLPSAALLAIGAVQILPAPSGLLAALSPSTWAAREAAGALIPGVGGGPMPASLAPPSTTDALLRLAACVLIGLAAAVALDTGARLRRLALVLVASGAFQALYGAAEYLSGRQQIFGYRKRWFLEEATGTFINRNHYAGFLVMILPVALALLIAGRRRWPSDASWRERLVATFDPRGLRTAGAAAGVVFIWGAVLLSYSRSGLVCALAATVLLGAVALAGPAGDGRAARSGRAAPRSRWLRAGLIASVMAVPILVLLVMDVRAPGERFAGLGRDLARSTGRLTVWKATFGMVRESPLLGTGLGTFESAFPAYQPGDLGGIYDHAHNDWLQGLAEGGPVVPAACVVLLWIVVAPLRRRPPTESGRIAAGAAAGVAAMALFSLVDFCLRMPANAAVLAVLAGMCLSGPALHDPSPTPLPSSPREPR